MIYNYKGKMVGDLIGDTFHKYVVRKRHLMKKLDAYAIQRVIFDAIKKDGALMIKVWETDTENRYESKIEDWDTYGVNKDVGHGLQVFLPLKYWDNLVNKKLTWKQ